MMIEYEVESFEQCIPEIMPLVESHWDEVTDHEWPADPDWDRFVELEKLGILRLLTVRDEARLVGYFIAIISPCLHYRTKKLAVDDAFYLMPEYRRNGIPVRMFREVETMLRADGVDRVVVHTKCKVPLDRFMNHLGYRHVEDHWWLDLS